MGGILFILFVAFIMVLVLMVISNYLNKKDSKPMSEEEKRKTFDDDIEAVAKKIKMRKGI
jgi:NADH:ubiquinone oxidoreductase subunit 3 (subunit A)